MEYDILNPNRVTTELDASDKLLTASAVIDMAPNNRPTVNFRKNSITLHIMPITDENAPFFALSDGVTVMLDTGTSFFLDIIPPHKVVK